MSRETYETLNTQTLIGFVAKRGHAWHYRAEFQGTESNHYDGAIPVQDVHRRLFDWTADSRPLFVQAGDPDLCGAMFPVPDRQAIVRSDTEDVLGIFKSGYEIHQYGKWLVDTVSTILDDSLSIGSAGLLRNGAQAWVSIEVPETITTPEGVAFRPNLIACTSHDGSLATTYKRVVQVVVCDNTLAAGLSEKGQTYKVKHSKYSNARIGEARQALAIVHTIADDFAAEVASLTRVDVSPKAWAAFLDAHAPMPTELGRAYTMAQNERDELQRLWTHDSRVAPWAGTAFGVVQAVNTYTHHYGTVRGASRPERNMTRAVTGGVDTLDASTLATLTKVLAS